MEELCIYAVVIIIKKFVFEYFYTIFRPDVASIIHWALNKPEYPLTGWINELNGLCHVLECQNRGSQ